DFQVYETETLTRKRSTRSGEGDPRSTVAVDAKCNHKSALVRRHATRLGHTVWANASAIVHRECGAALEQSADADLVLRGHRLAFACPCDREGLSAHGH